MQDYSNLFIESEKLSEFSKNNLENLFNLNKYFKSVYQSYIKNNDDLSKEINKIYVVKENESNYFNSICTNLIYSLNQVTIKKIYNVLNDYNDNIISPMDLFYKNLSILYTQHIDNFQNMKSSIIEKKQKLEESKQKYYESGNYVKELLLKNNNGNTIETEEILNAKYLKENYAQLYQYEVTQTNNIIEIYNKKYSQMHNKFIRSEESRISFIKEIFNKYIYYIHEYEKTYQELADNIKNIVNKINLEEDINKIKKEFNFNIYGERFQKEDYVEFFLEKNENINNSIYIKNNISNLVNVRRQNENDFELIKNEKSEKIIIENVINSQNQFLNNFINNLFDKKEIDVEKISQIMEKIYNDLDFSKEFIDYFVSIKKSSFYVFYNLNNLQHLANIFITINMNSELNNSTIYLITFAIIILSEKTYCIFQHNNKNKFIYLCALLSQNKLYSSQNFWKSLIEFKLAKKLEEHLNHLMNIDIIVRTEEEKDSNIQNSNNSVYKESKNKNTFFKNFANIVKGVISSDSENDNFNKNTINNSNTNKVKSLLENTGLSNIIHNYNKLPEYKKPFLDQFAVSEVDNILQEFIIHMCNFNLNLDKTINLVVEMCTKYQLTKEKINYYVANIGAWNFSIKKELPNINNEEIIIDKINDIKKKRADLINAKYPIAENIYAMKSHQKNIILVSLAKYINMNKLLNIFTLNKLVYSKGRKKIFKELLDRENLTLDKRLKIWKCLLNINEIKKNYIYENVQNDLYTNNNGDNKEKKIPRNISDIIKLDVKRTSFKTNEQEYKESLTKILESVAYLKPKLNYCQGMNFIASFLLQLTQNEKETFYLMIGLIEKTNFSLIFMEDLQKLKCFFYIFKRLMNILLPDLFYVFKSASVEVKYFSPAWFLTLFTNCAQFVDHDNPPKVVLKIWDQFFLKGWKALIITGLAIIKYNSNNLKNLKYDQILHFLINDVLKSEFFQNSFFEKYICLVNEMHVKNKLIVNLETEYNYFLKENNNNE